MDRDESIQIRIVKLDVLRISRTRTQPLRDDVVVAVDSGTSQALSKVVAGEIMRENEVRCRREHLMHKLTQKI